MKVTSILKNSRGQVLVITWISLLVILGVTALAIDLGIAYAIKAKINSAVDAAAIAGGKAVKIGATDVDRIANGEATATIFFNANYPAGFMGSTNTVFTPHASVNSDPTSTEYGTWTLTADASTRSPAFFSRIWGVLYSTVGASSESKTRTLDMMLVLDCSGSIGSDLSALKTAAMNFIDKFQDGTGGDRIGFVSFADGAVLNLPIDKSPTRGFDRSLLYNPARTSGYIPSLSSEGLTSGEEAMRKAKSELDAISSSLRSSKRVIVFFSDGAPNVVSGTFINATTGAADTGGLWSTGGSGAAAAIFPLDILHSNDQSAPNITTLPPTDYTGTVPLSSMYSNNPRPSYTSSNTRCNVNRAARNMLENVAISARSGAGNDAITVFSIGLGDQLLIPEVVSCGYLSDELGQNIMKRLANTQDSDRYNAAQPVGMYVYAANASQLNSAFQAVASMILRISR